MCTRFFIEPETEEFREILDKARASRLTGRFIHAGDALHTAGEIRPTDVVPVIAPNREGEEAVFPMRWGFRFPGRSLIVNARSETAAGKPAFRDSWSRRRCVIPASWYYEWEHLTAPDGRKKTGSKYLIQPRGVSVTWLAGLYRFEEELPVFTVLTMEPVPELRRIHDRMPVILPEDQVHDWIRPETRPEKVLPHALRDMVLEAVGDPE